MQAQFGGPLNACRYISEDFGGVALHPIDILDASTGRLLTQLVDANLSTICPVNKPHPRVSVIVSGSSRSLYAWRPVSRGSASAGLAFLWCLPDTVLPAEHLETLCLGSSRVH